jgi:hypothetical protein
MCPFVPLSGKALAGDVRELPVKVPAGSFQALTTQLNLGFHKESMWIRMWIDLHSLFHSHENDSDDHR